MGYGTLIRKLWSLTCLLLKIILVACNSDRQEFYREYEVLVKSFALVVTIDWKF